MSVPAGTAKLFTIAASANFAETLAEGLVARLGSAPLALSAATIYLPTRRAARSFADAFARKLGGAALLPQFRALGDVEDDDLLSGADSEDLTLTPAIAPLRRQLLLAHLVRRRGGLSFAQSAALAAQLASVMDEMETQGVDPAKLDELAPAALAQHWQEVRGFLGLLHEAWPTILEAEGARNPAARRNETLRALAARLAKAPPPGLVIAAGSTGSIPATADLLSAIARLPQGAVVLPGLDRQLDEESWTRLDAGHPQYGLKQLLARIGAAREDVADWAGPAPAPAREQALRETLRPAPTTDAWREIAANGRSEIARGLEGLAVLAANDPTEEALAIALALREALETPGRTAALVTPDRGLARRVAAELERWDIAIDDSAGKPLAHTSAGAFLCLVAEAAQARFAPVPLLALLKHPFARAGQDSAEFRSQARALDRALRGPRPDPGLDGIARRLGDSALAPWWQGVAALLRPLETAFAPREAFLSELLAHHLEAAEALAGEESALGRAEDGAAARDFAGALQEASQNLPAMETGSYAPLFRRLAMQVAVRRPFGRHPRLAVLGPLEARLQHFDRIVLGGLNEGSWPRGAAADPWFSRPMRQTLGLEPPERALGLSAHDFAMLAASPSVLLTRALKADGAPTVPSRWLQRLLQLSSGLGLKEMIAPPQPALLRWTRAFAAASPVARLKRPAPTPPVAARPRGLSVTEIEVWLRDPYAIYAKHVLKLRPFDALDEEVGPAEHGNAMHAVLERFVARFPGALPPDALAQFAELADTVLAERAIPVAARVLWRPRLLSAGAWFVEFEHGRRRDIARSFLEVTGRIILPAPGGNFELRARADRIDLLEGGGAAIIDYKTGALPQKNWTASFLMPQLPLEGAMLEAGGFDGVPPTAVEALLYLKLSGGAVPGEARWLEDAAQLPAEARAKLAARVAWFDQETTPYPPRLIPRTARDAGDYDHLARVREWAASEEEA